MTLEILSPVFSVAKISADTPLPQGKFVFFSRTDSENSLLCPSADMPKSTLTREDGWRGMRIVGTLEFSLIGILAKISDILAQAQVGIFAVSTYDTDYIFIKEENLSRAVLAFETNGYNFIS